MKPIRPEDSYTLDGMEQVDIERLAARQLAEAAEVTELLRRPATDISGRAGEMERYSPLVYGTGNNPTLF